MLNRLTWDVLGVVAVAIGASYTLTALARVVSYRIGLLDRPDGCRKSHTEPTPLLGGIALYGSLLIAIRSTNAIRDTMSLRLSRFSVKETKNDKQEWTS